ncbi:hypothetical protein KAX97_03760, partial [candidate division WOR-3 bacterium]|nr:hypothetical protein [candidate division WOR-3 bacterium]
MLHHDFTIKNGENPNFNPESSSGLNALPRGINNDIPQGEQYLNLKSKYLKYLIEEKIFCPILREFSFMKRNFGFCILLIWVCLRFRVLYLEFLQVMGNTRLERVTFCMS